VTTTQNFASLKPLISHLALAIVKLWPKMIIYPLGFYQVKLQNKKNQGKTVTLHNTKIKLRQECTARVGNLQLAKQNHLAHSPWKCMAHLVILYFMNLPSLHILVLST